ncbi:MAG: 1-deoxy-D-xylulose-5-phosphate synthase N-terminal domain-containing protein [Desulfobacterales bacterium]|nr:1-deoxy-D-xylulose-5-phosphate synthase N-terminal domain-containing protein [Desulfobacterales bacterium]
MGGTHGHPDLSVPGIEANSDSGVEISKAKGMAIAKKLKGAGGRVFVMTGDGELQEGQIWESLQTVTHQGISNVNVIVDCNKIQTDKPVAEIIDLGRLEAKFGAFGWHVARCDGHDFGAMRTALQRFKEITDKPKVLIADTIKGKGISFMEGPASLKAGQGLYRWHSGARMSEAFETGFAEIVERSRRPSAWARACPLHLEVIEERGKRPNPPQGCGGKGGNRLRGGPRCNGPGAGRTWWSSTPICPPTAV